MAGGFDTFDLGRVFQTAEAIKGLKREAESDHLRNQYLSTQMAGAQQNQQLQKQEADAQTTIRENKNHYLSAQAVENAADPIAAARELAPEMVSAFEQQHGPGTFERLPPDVVKQIARMGKEKSAAAAGINLQPSPDVVAQQGFHREMDDKNFGQAKDLAGIQHGYRLSETAAANATKPGRSIRAMTPDEVTAAGLPAGTAAQVDEQTGKIDVLTKRDTTGVLNQKDMTTAKLKLNTVALARQQLNKIREAFDQGTQGFNSFGPVQGYLPGEKGQIFDSRVNQMRSTLTALTRVPGVGAMSDYETKLDQSKFPDRTARESVTLDTLKNLDDQLSLIETGYKDLLRGGQQQGGSPNQQTGPAQIKSDAEYAQLPSGAQYIAPDGSTRTKR